MSNVIFGTVSAHLSWVKNNAMRVTVSKPVQALCSKTSHLENLPDGTNAYSWIAIAIWSLKTKVLSTEKEKITLAQRQFICYVLLAKGEIQATYAFPSKTKLAVHVPHTSRAREGYFQTMTNPIVK